MKNTLPPTEQKAEFVKQGFNEIAARYDLLNDVMTLGLHRHWKAEAIERLNLQPGMHLLDLCAGTGDLSFRAAARLNHDCETALDFVDMRAGRQRMESQEGRECIQWLCGCRSLPFRSRFLMVRWWVWSAQCYPSGYNSAEVLRVLNREQCLSSGYGCCG